MSNEKRLIAKELVKIAKELMIASGEKVYYTMENVGSAKYLVNFHDGVQKHKDGSAFYDIRTFKSKKMMDEFVMSLHNQGYKYKRP